MGAGTGRVVFALDKKLHNNSIEFFGVENSDSMLNFANHKNSKHDGVSKISFLKYDLTDSNFHIINEFLALIRRNYTQCIV